MSTGLTVTICSYCLEPVDDRNEHKLESGGWKCSPRKVGSRCSCGHRIRGKNHFLGAHHNREVPRNPRVR